MRYLIFLFPFVALAQTVNFSTYGGNGDGVTDNASAWASMKAAYLNGDFDTLEISSGTYDFNSTVDIAGCNGITIEAADANNKPLLFTDAGINWIIHTQANTDDVTIRNIRFENAGTIPSASQASTLGFSDARFFRHTITGCEFATTNASNGIKYYVTNNTTDFAGNITFIDNVFQNIGQMGVEFVNHRDDLFPGNTDYGYDNIVFRNNTFNNVGTANAFGMAISMSGEGETVTVESNNFTDCPNTAVEFIGTDNSQVLNNTFAGNTRPYNFVRGNGRTNDNNLIRGNSGTVTQGAIFINVTNTTIENEEITFGERFFMQGIRNITFNNCRLSGVGDVLSFRSATSAEQEVHSDEGILRIDNSVITSTTNPAIDVQSVHHQMTLQVNCSELRIASGTNYISEAGGNGVTITYNNTERYSADVLQDTQNAAGATNCLDLPQVIALSVNSNQNLVKARRQ